MGFFHSLIKGKHTEPQHDNSDYITGLLNRRDGERKIKAAMSQENGCLAFIDLDNLKPINDTYGHPWI